MQSKPIKTSHNTSNISLPHQLANFNHGNFNQKLKSDNLLLSFEEESCRSKYLEALYDDGSCSENAILQTQPNDILQDTEIISNSSSIPTKPEHESLILTYLEESNENFEASKETKSQNRQNGAATLSEVPNEILTQILSFLPESSIITTSLVSKRFNKLVATSHVWRTAFFRVFRGPCIHRKVEKDLSNTLENREEYNTELLLFNRLSRQGSWRREYILRTRLLRSLGRGKPAQNKSNKENVSPRKSDAKNINPVITYNSHLSAPISHIHAKFDNGTKPPSIIHGSNELSSVTISDPTNGKIGKWRASELSGMLPSTDAWTDQLLYGMGDGPVLIPNSMDVSQLHGVIFGEGIPGGKTYYQSSNELRGRYLTQASDFTDLENGIPKIPEIIDGVSAVWIAKSNSVPSMTDELIGMLRGSTMGIVSAYATGLETHARCIPKGLVTAKWVLSPGVPIIAFDVDDSYNAERKACGRVWAVALNALGEVFYLNQTPSHVSLETSEVNKLERLAWSVGRTVHWHMISVSRRIARNISNRELENNLGYSPRSSSNDLNLSKAQIRDETMEIESFFRYPPAHFRKIYESWDMRRRLHVDFAGDDSNGAGEAIVVIKCGDSSGHGAEVRRMTRIGRKRKFFERDNICQESGPHLSTETIDQSMDAPQDLPLKDTSFLTFSDIDPLHKRDKNSNSRLSSSSFRFGDRSGEGKLHEEWQNTIFTMKDHFKSQITCSAIDMSTFALLTINEDPISTGNDELLDETSKKVTGKSSPFPGHRARFLIVGTKIGSLIIWNMRGPRSSDVSIVNELHPVRKIFTDSPEISCIAVSALYIVHGGNDGLVQAWNTLASGSQPVRTLHSRFSSKLRRRLPQNVATSFDLGANFKAAGAIILDPDPTRLRGIVSIGSQLRYWSYSSSASDEFPRKRHRRQLLDRGMSARSDRFSSSGRGAIRDHITTEHEDLKKDEIWKTNQTKHLSNRFGVGMFGLTEEEAILYAELVSAEDFEKKSDQCRWTDSQSVGSNEASESLFPRNIPITFDSQDACTSLDDYEQQISEAIRLSLLESKSEQEKL